MIISPETIPSTPEKHVQKRISAAWAGLMLGDALGAAAEFCTQEDILEHYPEGLWDMVPGFGICTDRRAGEVTDDTQMAYCLHQALLEADGWNPEITYKHYLAWFATNPPDIGEATEAALSGHPNPESQGNGALMRVLPIALWAATHPGFDWKTAAREDAFITHPHPVCGDANVVFVHALLTSLQPDVTAEDIQLSALEFAVENNLSSAVVEAVAADNERPDYDGEHIGWVLVALHSAFYQLKNASSFRSALVDIVSSGGDTDTNAAIAGALLGMWKGLRHIPRTWLQAVHAANLPCYTALLPSVKDVPLYPSAFYPKKHKKPRQRRPLAGISIPLHLLESDDDAELHQR